MTTEDDRWSKYKDDYYKKNSAQSAAEAEKYEMTFSGNQHIVRRGNYNFIALGDTIYFYELLQELKSLLTKEGIEQFIAQKPVPIANSENKILQEFCNWTIKQSEENRNQKVQQRVLEIEKIRKGVDDNE